MINPVLLNLAQHRVWKDAGREKQAFQPPGGGAPGGGAPGGGGAAPPPDPSMMGGQPGMPPGGMPGASPAPPPGMTPGMGMGMPQAAPQGQGAGAKPKFDPLMLDYRIYNLQQQLSAIMAAMNIQVPPGALIMPPGTMGAPPAEQALPGAPMDPNQQQQQGQGQGGGGQSAISPIEPMQGASPQLAQQQGKTAAQLFAESFAEPEQVVESTRNIGLLDNAAAVSAMLRSKVLNAAL